MRIRYPVMLATLLLCSAGEVRAQQELPWDAAGQRLTRTDLQTLLARYDSAASSSSYSRSLRERAQREAALIRTRLEEGDLRPGDKVALTVEGFEALTDTFTVTAAKSLVLPQIGSASLAGVLRSELQQHLFEQISRFIRNPIVHAQALIRMEIIGAVGQPGYFAIPSEILVSDALMAAGGPSPQANLDKIRIERSSDVIWNGESLRQAMFEGRTLDQLSVRAGDRIVVPEKRSKFDVIRTVLGVAGGLASVLIIIDRLGG